MDGEAGVGAAAGTAGAGGSGALGSEAGASAASPDAGSSAAGTPGGGASGASGPGKRGLVILAWDGSAVSATALFSGGGPASQAPLCSESQFGACRVQVCSTADSGTEGGQPANAGVITISGGSEPVVLTPSAQFTSLYELTGGAQATFVSGSAIIASASGASVGAFTSKALKLPAPIQVMGDYTMIPFDSDLPVAWTGGASIDSVSVELNVLGDTAVADLVCQFPASAGRGVVPRAALAQLPSCAVDQGPICNLVVEPRASTSFVDGEHTVELSVRARGETVSFSN